MPSVETGSLASLRDRNRLRVVDVLRRRGTASRADIARETGLSRSTVSTIVGAMQRDGLLAERAGAAPRGPEGGRPPVLLAFQRSVGALAGIELGHDRVRVALADLAYGVLGEETLADDIAGDPAAALHAAAVAVDRLIAASGTPRDRVIGVGVALAEPINRETGVVRSDAIAPAWAGFDPAAVLEEELSLPIHLDGDANAGALADFIFGAAQGYDFAAYVRLSATIGIGLVLNGRLFRGAGGAAGELGHVVIDPNGPICRCGNRGCLETFAGGPALLDQLKRSHGDLTVPRLLELAAEGDRGCQRVIFDAGRVVGLALADLCNTVNPDVVVVGGELAAAGDLLLDPLRAAIRQHVVQTTATSVAVVASPLGDRAELMGALALAGHQSADAAAAGVGGADKRRRATP